MYSIVSTAILHGIDSILVKVEADVSTGMPVFEMVGFLGSEVKEAKERVRTALKNAGYQLPAKRITVNLSPAGLRKSGSGFDLPIAVAVMAALGIIEEKRTKDILVIGEIGLDGTLQPIQGIFPIVLEAEKQGFLKCMVPYKNATEAGMVKGIEIIPVQNLEDVITYFRSGEKRQICPVEQKEKSTKCDLPDFSEMHGQPFLKRACEVAVAGMHNLLMIGPPGAGKTMAAKRIPSILPPMSEKEQMELAKIYSICGMWDEKEPVLMERPFRSPHHTITPQGLAGGGRTPKPGEISLAHHGVLFLDELTEFRKETLEILRQPLEEHSVHLVRASGTYHYPADFILVAAMNPCSCGNFPDRQKCRCSMSEIRRYLSRISQPLLNRIDLCVEVPRLSFEEVAEPKKEETSEMIRNRILAVHELQKERFKEYTFSYNSQMPVELVEEYCMLDQKKKAYMKQIYTSFQLNARAYYKILKVARTIADLDGSKEVEFKHLNEAVCYRTIDKKFWEQTV